MVFAATVPPNCFRLFLVFLRIIFLCVVFCRGAYFSAVTWFQAAALDTAAAAVSRQPVG
jgi:hypothetical protein